MKINTNGMMYNASHTSMDNGYRQNGRSGNHESPSGLYVVKKSQDSAIDFSDLILDEFKGRKVFSGQSEFHSARKSSRSSLSVNPDEINALNILNEYWA